MELGLYALIASKVLREANVLSPKGQEADGAPRHATDILEEAVTENGQQEKAIQKLVILKGGQNKICSNSVRKFSFVSYRGSLEPKPSMDISAKPPPGSRERPPT